MEIFGGFMAMLSILGFFLAVLWFILPFVVFAMKGKLDRALELLESTDRRLATLEKLLNPPEPVRGEQAPPVTESHAPPPGAPPPATGD